MRCVDITEFLQSPGVILDVRSPGEFACGRIPGAVNLPLFSDEERAILGAKYHQEGREEAVQKGFELVVPNLVALISKAKYFSKGGPVRVHCWRGGMRSESVSALLHQIGIPTIYLKDGYKAFRRWSLDVLAEPRKIAVVGGLTGSGKTEILHALGDLGEQILDLESLASHRGSSYGTIGMPSQPTVEQFQNEIAVCWDSFDPEIPVWIEDESHSIGKCFIPNSIYDQMQSSPLYFVDRPLSERLHILIRDYGNTKKQDLIEATLRIKKKLGGLRTEQVIEAIDRGNLKAAAEILLDYYDRTYRHMMQKREKTPYVFTEENLSPAQWAEHLLSESCNILHSS